MRQRSKGDERGTGPRLLADEVFEVAAGQWLRDSLVLVP